MGELQPVALRLLVSLLVVIVVTAAGPRSAAIAADPIPSAAVVQDQLVIPWDVAFTPDGTMLVTERPGRVRVYASGSPGAALVSTTTVPAVRSEHESGLNGIAIDIDFASNRFVYVCASRDPDGSGGPDPWLNEILRYRLTSSLRLDRMAVVWSGAPANRQHNGCSLRMDGSGHLWVGIGDRAVPETAQDPNSFNGKILRMTRAGGVPPDNPILPGAPGRSVIYSMGHRNPQGIAFEPGTGRIYAAEHGPNVNDEINWIRPGHNYGWPCFTGADRPQLALSVCGSASDYTPPAWASGSSTIATSGLTFLSHSTWGDWRGSAVSAQLKESDLRRFVGSGGGSTLTQAGLFLDGDYGRLRAAVQAPGGALYVTTSNGTGDRVLRITPGTRLIERYAGADRYATAALVSSRTFTSPVPTVYIATGATYPDALTGGAAAASDGGPVLLVTHSSIPLATRTEIQRLAPQRIVVLGGTSAISPTVFDQLDRLAPGGAGRLAGADRYATAAAVSRASFPRNVPVAYVATGTDYPDALGGVPAAGVEGGPILLVRSGAVPAPTRAELDRLRPQRIVVLGGTAAISALVASQLQAYTPAPIQRRGGVDRYETAVKVSQASFPKGAARVFIATGANFPDGLSGGPAAARERGPLLLVRPDSLPASVRAELRRLGPSRVTILGGMVAISDRVRAQISAALGP